MTKSILVDFHCHLDLYPDHAAAVEECERLGVFTLAVTTTPRAWPRNHQLATATRHVRAALGLHPQLVADHADVCLLVGCIASPSSIGGATAPRVSAIAPKAGILLLCGK